MKIIKDNTYKGTRILLGNEKREAIDQLIQIALDYGAVEINIPIIQFQSTFENKVGEENSNMMYNFSDKKDRQLCLAPEYTAVIQQLAKTHFKHERDKMVFYVQECFRGEKPQKGRYRQFTQFGIEIINPTDEKESLKQLISISKQMINVFFGITIIHVGVKRGLDYYKTTSGFEIKTKDYLQLVGGGAYEGGVGFAIGVDRLL